MGQKKGDRPSIPSHPSIPSIRQSILVTVRARVGIVRARVDTVRTRQTGGWLRQVG